MVAPMHRHGKQPGNYGRRPVALPCGRQPGRAIGGGQVDTRAAAGRLMLNVFAAFAQFELKIMKERQREGIADAKAAGNYKGRRPTARAKPQMWSGCLKAANECPRSRGRSISDGPVSTGRLRMLN